MSVLPVPTAQGAYTISPPPLLLLLQCDAA